MVHSEWAAPLVPVIKPSGKLRLCGDYKVTVNKVVKSDRYPLPLVDEIFAGLAGGKSFSKLDLSQAYHQIALDEDSMKYTTVNTHCGLFEYVRLPFGISTAVGLFQRAIETLLKGKRGVSVYLDDILITGDTEEEHLENLRNMLECLQENGPKLKREKCDFFLSAVEYLGYTVTAEGIKSTENKVKAITQSPASTNIGELR